MIMTPPADAVADMLFLALDLGGTTWKLAFGIARDPEPRIRTMTARHLDRLLEEIAAAKPSGCTARCTLARG